MLTVSSKELRTRLGKYLNLVREGNPVQITHRGRPIACIIPAQSCQETGSAERLARLVAEGAVRLGSGRLAPGKPAILNPGPSIVEMLNEERR